MPTIAHRAAFFLVIFSTAGFGQTLGNSTLTGKYFARHIEFTTDANGNETDARSITGTITFDGGGNYSFSGQQVIGPGSAASFSVNGTYSVAPAGTVTLTNPQTSTLSINARYSTEAVVGSSTEAPGHTFDLFVAIPAPSSSGPALTNQALSVNYHMVDFELTNASTAQIRTSGMQAQFSGAGSIATFLPLGHVAGVSGGATQTSEEFTGTYSVNGDGTGSITFSPVSGTTTAANILLAGGTRNLYVSATDNMFLAATPGSHDIMIGVQNAATDTISFSGKYWVASLSVSSDFVASASVATSVSTVFYTQRTNTLTPPAPGVPNVYTQTATGGYAVSTGGFGGGCHCGIGTTGNVDASGNAFLLLGNNGTFVGVTPGEDASGNPYPTAFAIQVGVPIPTLTGTGVWINPQGIVNASTYAPVGDNISPGELIQIYGSGLYSGTAASETASALPFPSTLGNVSVSINGQAAPMYYVSPGLLICIVPYEVTGTSATIVVTNNKTASNAVTVSLAPFTPGVISANDYGFGDGAITHANNTSVNSSSPAQVGETVQMYVTGLGALSTPVVDGNGFIGIDDATNEPEVFLNNTQAAVTYWGLTADAGLYQINFTIPAGTPSGEQSVAIGSSNGTVAEVSQTITVAVQ